MHKLELDSVVLNFGEVKAVDHVSMEAEEGESVVLLGPSGCGKTTTLRLIAGFLKPQEGTIRIEGREVASPTRMVPPDQRNLPMVFQNYAVWPHRTVWGNIAYGLKLRKLSRGEIERKVTRVLELVKMSHLKDRYPAELSGGQQQRVALARALVLEPTILLLDEPLSNLDATLREEMRFEIKDLKKKLGFTSIYVTHDQQEAMVIADRLIVMNDGRIEQEGTPDEIYQHPASSFVAGFIGLTNLIEGKIIGIDSQENMTKVRTKFGTLVVALPHDKRKDSLKEGKEIRVSIRPESISLSTNRMKDAVNCFSGHVDQKLFLGSLIDLYINLAGERIRVQIPSSGSRDFGRDVYASLSPHECHLVED